MNLKTPSFFSNCVHRVCVMCIPMVAGCTATRSARPSGRRLSVRCAFAPRKELSSNGSPALLWSCDRPDPDWVNFKKQEEAPVRMEMLVVARHSLLVLLLATPSLHGNAGVWQFPAYGPSPTPLESPTPRVARAAIPKDLVSGITVAHALIIGPRLTF